jgi:riboflavin-specific deaminase-like protein
MPPSLPRVTVSYAQSLDGRIATATGDSRYISCPATLRLAQRLRRDNQAILVGIGTVLRDDPELSCRLPGCASPLRVVLDSHLRLPLESTIVRTADRLPTIVFCAGGAEATDCAVGERRGTLVKRGLRVMDVEADPQGLLAPRRVLEVLGREGLDSLFVEGGGRVITSFLRAGVVRRMLVVVAPLLIGEGVAAVGELGVRALADALRPRRARVRRLGCDRVWDLDLDEA